MFVLLYLNSDSPPKVTGYEILPAKPATLPSGTGCVEMSAVPDGQYDDFFESPSVYVLSSNSLTRNGTANKRILKLSDLDATTQSKVNATPWARTKLVKTRIFNFL